MSNNGQFFTIIGIMESYLQEKDSLSDGFKSMVGQFLILFH